MIGETITVNGVKCLVLDEIDGNPFVIALEVGIDFVFGNSNNYKESTLRKGAEAWLKKTGIKAIPRDVDLTAMDGYKGYGSLNTAVAPLTFDEYRKYNHILTPHIKNWFWLVTPWGSPEQDNWASYYVCVVITDGSASPTTTAAAGWRRLSFLIKNGKSLSDFTNEELIAELNKRLKV